MDNTKSNSFCCNLNKWYAVMKKYEEGGFMYYTTFPTDAMMVFAKTIKEIKEFGFENC